MMTVGKEKELERVSELIEFDFELIGSTAIEDKLQEDVGRTISDIKSAGIQVWVLTGDKVETAINIGYSCELLSNDMNMFIIQEKKPKRLRIEIADFTAKQKITYQARPNAVIIAGESLAAI